MHCHASLRTFCLRSHIHPHIHTRTHGENMETREIQDYKFRNARTVVVAVLNFGRVLYPRVGNTVLDTHSMYSQKSVYPLNSVHSTVPLSPVISIIKSRESVARITRRIIAPVGSPSFAVGCYIFIEPNWIRRIVHLHLYSAAREITQPFFGIKVLLSRSPPLPTFNCDSLEIGFTAYTHRRGSVTTLLFSFLCSPPSDAVNKSSPQHNFLYSSSISAAWESDGMERTGWFGAKRKRTRGIFARAEFGGRPLSWLDRSV